MYLSVLSAQDLNSEGMIDTSNNTNCSCCSKVYSDFDFWIGEWTVYDTIGNRLGKNSLRKIQDNCILQENWIGDSGTTGTSINFYNKIDSKWHQVWVDNAGNVLKLKGELVNKEMVLKSELFKRENVNVYHRIKWSLTKEGEITQKWDLLNEENEIILTLFIGIYKLDE